MVKLNVCSGRRDWSSDGWTSIDGHPWPHVSSSDIFLTDYADNSIDQIFCSHGIAYTTDKVLVRLLKCWYDALRPGGLLEVATPDLEVLMKLYHTGTPYEQIKGPMFGAMIMGDDLIHHKNCYDERTLTRILAEAGFIDIERYNHRLTNHPNTGDRSDYFDDCSSAYIGRHLVSLNMKCVKPF